MSKNTDKEKVEALWEKYRSLTHAMQTGVQLELDQLGVECAGANPKHLRVGVNAALCEQGALAYLLIGKGVITELEYVQSLVDIMQKEVDQYQQRISEELQTQVTLL